MKYIWALLLSLFSPTSWLWLSMSQWQWTGPRSSEEHEIHLGSLVKPLLPDILAVTVHASVATNRPKKLWGTRNMSGLSCYASSPRHLGCDRPCVSGNEQAQEALRNMEYVWALLFSLFQEDCCLDAFWHVSCSGTCRRSSSLLKCSAWIKLSLQHGNNDKHHSNITT